MSKKWKKIHESDKNLLLSKEDSKERGEYIFKSIEEVKYPHHLHFGSDFMRITNEKNKELSFPRLCLDEKAIDIFLQKIKTFKDREILPYLLNEVTLLVPKNPDASLTQKELQDDVLLQLMPNSKCISGKEFVRVGYLGIINFMDDNPKFLVCHDNKIYWATIEELIKINPEVNQFMTNKDKLIEDKRKQLETKN